VTAASEFVLPVDVRWGHCDPAGIVYFPQYFDMFHEAMEAWFSACLGVPYQVIIHGRKLGFPSVHTEADFGRPSAFGDAIDVRLSVTKLGRTSIEFLYRVTDRDDTDAVRATGRTVCVVMDLDPTSAGFRRAAPFPDDLRARIEPLVAAPVDGS
jgi:4-hydroxybenzoyl-CoA thioesterase